MEVSQLGAWPFFEDPEYRDGRVMVLTQSPRFQRDVEAWEPTRRPTQQEGPLTPGKPDLRPQNAPQSWHECLGPNFVAVRIGMQEIRHDIRSQDAIFVEELRIDIEVNNMLLSRERL